MRQWWKRRPSCWAVPAEDRFLSDRPRAALIFSPCNRPLLLIFNQASPSAFQRGLCCSPQPFYEMRLAWLFPVPRQTKARLSKNEGERFEFSAGVSTLTIAHINTQIRTCDCALRSRCTALWTPASAMTQHPAHLQFSAGWIIAPNVPVLSQRAASKLLFTGGRCRPHRYRFC